MLKGGRTGDICVKKRFNNILLGGDFCEEINQVWVDAV